MSWEQKITDLITSNAKYSFGSSAVVDPEEMETLCRQVVQLVEDTMVELAYEMHMEGVKDGYQACEKEVPEDLSLSRFLSERLFRNWEKKQRDNYD